MKSVRQLSKNARSLYKRWQGSAYDAEFDTEDIDTRILTFLGVVTRLEYVSDKQEEDSVEYFHDFKKPCLLLSLANGRGLVILPTPRSRLIVSPRGIVG